MQINKTKIFRWIKIVIILYCGIGIALYYLQDYFLFHPKKLDRTHVFNFGKPFDEVFIPVNKTDTINLIQFLPADSIRKGIVIYFHGNMNNVEHYAPFTDVFTKKGYEVWMPDYPGYGKSTGVLTEQKLYDYAMQVQRLAMTNYHSDSIIIYGKSLGTGVAAYVASSTANKMLILETPYSNMPDLFSSHSFIYPATQMSKYKLPTDQFLDDVKIPITIMHGTADWVISMRCAIKLKAHLKAADKFIVIDGADHHNINQQQAYFKVIDSLL